MEIKKKNKMPLVSIFQMFECELLVLRLRTSFNSVNSSEASRATLKATSKVLSTAPPKISPRCCTSTTSTTCIYSTTARYAPLPSNPDIKSNRSPSPQGYYTPSTFSNSSSTPTKNVTRCSHHTAFFNFNLSAILQSELLPDITLADLDWPSKLDDALAALGVLSKAMFALYCIGAGFAVLAVLAAAYALCGGWLGVHLGEGCGKSKCKFPPY
jgi:SUR7/PalI family